MRAGSLERVTDARLAVIAHALRNSMGTLRNTARFLDGQPADTLAFQNARLRIERQVGQMSKLLDELLEVSATPNAP